MELSIKELKVKRIHFIGIGGISMSALAQILRKNGCYVQGSDLSHNDETVILQRKKIKVYYEHKKENLKDIDVVVYSSAIHEDNEELKYARDNNLIILKRAELLGIIAKNYDIVISIAGSHGKTTTTAMIAEMFSKANLKPTIHIGGRDNYLKSNYKLGNKKFFITEACEYMDNYLYVKSDIAVVLNIDSDHLDYFKDLEGVKLSFEKFSKNIKEGGIVIANGDDKNMSSILNGQNVTTFGLNKKNEIYATNIKEYEPCKYSFDVVFCGAKLGNIKLNILGKHNIYNALVTILVGIACEIDFCYILNCIENFEGVERRCSYLGKLDGAVYFHDYAHHPKQIEKMIEVAKDYVERSKGKIITVFEPHTYSRTKYLLSDFAKSFVGSDILILCPVYSARELESDGKNSLDLSYECEKLLPRVEYYETFDEIINRLKKVAGSNDIVLVLGAGTIENLAKKISK